MAKAAEYSRSEIPLFNVKVFDNIELSPRRLPDFLDKP